MEIGAGVAAELTLLSEALYDPTAGPTSGVADNVLAVAASARAAVTSWLGLTVILSVHGGGAADQVALQFTLLEDDADPREVGSSLRLPQQAGGPGPGEPAVTVVLYAASLGDS